MPDMIPADSTLGHIGGPYPYRVRPLNVGQVTNTSKELVARSGLLLGLSALFKGSDEVELWDGEDGSGTSFLLVAGVVDTSQNLWFGPNGIYVQNGLYVRCSAAATLYSVFWVDLYD